MLKSLFIQNYALIDTLDIRFEPGFSVITGETGAGKSIILGAIGLLLGQRADSKAIKNGAPKCVIEATFDLSAYGMEDFFTRNDLEFDGKECIVRREITAAGKSRAFINDTPASVAQLKELGEMLIDVHSQHQNLLLNKENFQLKVIDILARDKEELQRYKECYSTYKTAEKTLRQAQQEAEKAREEEDYLAFQLEQLDNAALKSGEQEELEKEQELLSHAEEIKQVLYQTGQMLDNDQSGILDALKEARHLLAGLAKAYPDGNEPDDTFRLVSKYRILNGGFETGNLTGWTLSRAEGSEGDIGTVTSQDTYWQNTDFPTTPYGKDGTYLFSFWTWEGDAQTGHQNNREGFTGTLTSSIFTLKAGATVCFLLGGGGGNPDVYLEFVNANTGEVIAKFMNTSPKDAQLIRYYYRFTELSKDTECYIRVTDNATSSWGCFTLDGVEVNRTSIPEGFHAAVNQISVTEE